MVINRIENVVKEICEDNKCKNKPCIECQFWEQPGIRRGHCTVYIFVNKIERSKIENECRKYIRENSSDSIE
jgi:hypothetical protein